MQKGMLLSVAVTAAVLVSGCGSDDPVVDDLLAPPAAGEGVQFSMITDLEPGSEVEHCKFVLAPAEGMNVNRDEVRYTKGSHHFLLYETSYDSIPTKKDDGTAVDTSGVFDCSDGATNGWSITQLVGGSQNSSGDSMLNFPDGVAKKVRPGAVLLMNAHYINASSEPLQPEVRINLYTIDDSAVVEVGDVLFWYNIFIGVEGQSSGQARMRCPINTDITITNAQSHMHRLGVDYSASEMAKSPFYTNTAWENVPVKRFEAGMQVPAGSMIDYQCDYQNPGTDAVYQGARSTDEMCMLIASYYPADPATSYCAPAERPEANNIGADWVGHGDASCAQTLGCVQTASQGDFFTGLTGCVAQSDPTVSKEMSAVIRCLFLTFADGTDFNAVCAEQLNTCLGI